MTFWCALPKGCVLCLALALGPRLATAADFNTLPDVYSVIRRAAINIVNPDHSVILGAAADANSLFAVGERGLILQSTDAGATWRQLPCPIDVTLTAIEFNRGGQGWIVGHEGTVLHTADGGASWKLEKTDARSEDILLDVWFQDSSRGFITGTHGLVRHTLDGGRTWSEQHVTTPDGFDPHLHAVRGLSDGTVIVVGEAGSVFRAIDGEHWEALHVPYSGTFFGVAPISTDAAIVFGMRGNAFTTYDSGANWEKVDTGTDKSLFASAAAGDQIIVGGADGTIIRSALTRPVRFSHASAKSPLGSATITALTSVAPGKVVIASNRGVIGTEEP
jgi:photosystem II stability/assembly factor-like uncharacterized protein